MGALDYKQYSLSKRTIIPANFNYKWVWSEESLGMGTKLYYSYGASRIPRTTQYNLLVGQLRCNMAMLDRAAMPKRFIMG